MEKADLIWIIGSRIYYFNSGSVISNPNISIHFGKPPSLDLTREDLPFSARAIVWCGNKKIRRLNG